MTTAKTLIQAEPKDSKKDNTEPKTNQELKAED